MTDLEEWTPPTDDITTKHLDERITFLDQAKSAYEEAKKLSDEAHRVYDAARSEVMALMEQAGKKSYKVDGVGSVSLRHDLKVKYPATLDDRSKFLEWLRSKGDEFFNTTVSVNYQTLNSLYNSEFQAAVEAGQGMFEIPGISQPTSEPILSFRRNQ